MSVVLVELVFSKSCLKQVKSELLFVTKKSQKLPFVTKIAKKLLKKSFVASSFIRSDAKNMRQIVQQK